MNHRLIAIAALCALLGACQCKPGNSASTAEVMASAGSSNGAPPSAALLKALSSVLSLSDITAKAKQVRPAEIGSKSDGWVIYGHSSGGVFDDAGKLVVLYWKNNNPGQPPDRESGICDGPFWHWAYAKDLNYWTVSYACRTPGTPGWENGSFFAR